MAIINFRMCELAEPPRFPCVARLLPRRRRARTAEIGWFADSLLTGGIMCKADVRHRCSECQPCALTPTFKFASRQSQTCRSVICGMGRCGGLEMGWFSDGLLSDEIV